MPSFLEQINFKKVITILATIFGIALGLCGLNLVASRGGNLGNGLTGLIMGAAFLELATMVLSLLGLILVSILWLTATLTGKKHQEEPDIQKLFDDSDEEK